MNSMDKDIILKHQEELAVRGFIVIDNVFSASEIAAIIAAIAAADTSGPAFRKTSDLFAIRQLLKIIPGINKHVFTPGLQTLIQQIFGTDYFPVKSIYFDKPGQSNWFVAWHQDLTISIDKKLAIDNYGPWTVKQDQYAVQPPVDILESNFTIRIHLDDTDETNGALKVIPGSHLKGIYRAETIDFSTSPDVSCRVKKGGIMIMRPLLMHASGRSSNGHSRRVVHIEFTNRQLPEGLKWSEH
ncbi:phytanoyl-CoA dioxygenase PhyH [Chitinophaga niastensis]|uniref:Phytanoyl-CoA dioxygenase PhyH n=1 Tax=Chitinophaga niastensis TaxID=536980 RepID=A0A2P8HGX6_CHINA|nr:phytanoyl-CoA dioxygenase family protein [Chitinophaga niastensis]PSL45461.1 phytanoyl-CoA dioxygenase PhyH [Chitinophaga niastensis]